MGAKLLVVLVVGVAFLGACGSDSSELPVLKVEELTKKAQPAVGGATVTACPVGYDVAAAAKAAGLSGPVALSEFSPPGAETSDSADAGSFVKQAAPAVSIECDYTVDDAEVKTFLFVTGQRKAAVSATLPYLSAWSGTGPSDLAGWVKDVVAAKPGTAVAVPNGKAAVVRLNVKDGDGALAVGPGAAGGMSATQVTTLAEKLATQAH